MGKFISAEDLKLLTSITGLKFLELQVLELRHIRPAEARLELAFNLDLETSRAVAPVSDPEDIPCAWRTRMDDDPSLKEKYFKDMRCATAMLIDRSQANPTDLVSEATGGASATYGRSIPREVVALVAPWGQPCRVVRT